MTNDELCAGLPPGMMNRLNELGNPITTGGVDACHSDGGGPLVCNINNEATIVAMISRGTGCGTPGYPGIYFGVSRHIDWIKQHLNEGKH